MLSDKELSPQRKVKVLFKSLFHWNKFVKKREHVTTPTVSTYNEQVCTVTGTLFVSNNDKKTTTIISKYAMCDIFEARWGVISLK